MEIMNTREFQGCFNHQKGKWDCNFTDNSEYFNSDYSYVPYVHIYQTKHIYIINATRHLQSVE